MRWRLLFVAVLLVVASPGVAQEGGAPLAPEVRQGIRDTVDLSQAARRAPLPPEDRALILEAIRTRRAAADAARARHSDSSIVRAQREAMRSLLSPSGGPARPQAARAPASSEIQRLRSNVASFVARMDAADDPSASPAALEQLLQDLEARAPDHHHPMHQTAGAGPPPPGYRPQR